MLSRNNPERGKWKLGFAGEASYEQMNAISNRSPEKIDESLAVIKSTPFSGATQVDAHIISG